MVLYSCIIGYCLIDACMCTLWYGQLSNFIQQFNAVKLLLISISGQLFPIPGEVRFFTGDIQFPPHMIWQYREPRCVTRVHVLPVPLGILSHEDPPTDLTVRLLDIYIYIHVCSLQGPMLISCSWYLVH